MTQKRVSPPPRAACLDRPYRSSQKGGTLIAEGVVDRAAHAARVADPDGYRPQRCPHCGHEVLHVHDYRERQLRNEPGEPVIRIVRHRCAPPGCGARWQTLPAFAARHLWRSWRVIQAVVHPATRHTSSTVPARTVRRWRARLWSSARTLMQVLATSGNAMLEAVAQRIGLDGTRGAVVAALAMPLVTIAGLIQRLSPGVRLM